MDSNLSWQKSLLCALLCCASVIACQAQYVDIAPEIGLNNVNEETEYGNGISFYDFNHDGWDDLTIANGDEAPIFLLNNNGILEPATFNIPIDPTHHLIMLLWGDIENDGDSDLLTTQLEGPMQLWVNDGNFVFTDMTEEAGLIMGNWRYRGAAFADYDHDGFIDLYVAKYYSLLNNENPDFASRLFHNNGDGTFEDVTEAAGVFLNTSPVFQPVFLDYNNDGWEDLYLVIDRNFWENKLFRNNHDGTFEDVSEASGANPAVDAMSCTPGDYDNDGDLDIYISNGWPGNHLYKNNGDGTFNNIASSAGVMVNMICWGSSWIDYDNDTWQDLYVGTTGNFFGAAQSHFFINEHNDSFSNGDTIVGIAGDTAAVMVVAKGDLNNDGYLDFVTNSNDPFPSEVWLNDGGENHYVSISLQGVLANRDGIGSWVHCYAGGQHFVQYSLSGSDFNAQSSGKLIFGLDSLTLIDSLVVEWNSGTIDSYYNVEVNQFLHLVEGASFAVPFELTLSGDTLICADENVILDAGDYLGYFWSTGDTTRTIDVSEPGEYYVYVTDQFQQFSSLITEIQFAPQPMLTLNLNHASCYGYSDGSIAVGDLNEALVEVSWWDGQTAFERNELYSGEYFFTYTDIYGCIHMDSAEVIEPDPIEIISETIDADCFGQATGSVALSISGGVSPYAVDWVGLFPDALAAGSYAVVVADSNGCQQSAFFIIEESSPINVTSEVFKPLCNGETNGEVVLSISGGAEPYTIDWNGLDPLELSAGEYQVQVFDSLGCEATHNFDVLDPDSLTCNVIVNPFYEDGEEGSAEVVVAGGTTPYEILWSVSENNEWTIDGLEPGNYSVMVTDMNDCSCESDFEVAMISAIEERKKSLLIYPNPANMELRIMSEIGLLEIGVRDMTGRSVNGWNANLSAGYVDVSSLPQGVFLMYVKTIAEFHIKPFMVSHD